MPKRLTVTLSDNQLLALERIANAHHPGSNPSLAGMIRLAIIIADGRCEGMKLIPDGIRRGGKRPGAGRKRKVKQAE